MITTIGYIATIVSLLRIAPQIYKALKTKSTGDLSWGWILFDTLSLSLWFWYGWLIIDEAFILVLSCGIEIGLMFWLMGLKFKYDKGG